MWAKQHVYLVLQSKWLHLYHFSGNMRIKGTRRKLKNKYNRLGELRGWPFSFEHIIQKVLTAGFSAFKQGNLLTTANLLIMIKHAKL
jgi:hypothetical protein